MRFFAELKRRHVVRMAIFYLLGAWLVLQVADVVTGLLSLPEWTLRLVALVLLLGLPFALVLSWVYKLTPEGLKHDSTDEQNSEDLNISLTQRVILLISAVVFVVGGFFIIERFLLIEQGEPVTAETKPVRTKLVTMAVLPIEPVNSHLLEHSGERSLSEILIEALSEYEDVRIISPERLTPSDTAKQTAKQLAKTQLATHWFIARPQVINDAVWLSIEIVDIESEERIFSFNPDSPIIADGQVDSQIQARLIFEIGKALEEENLTEMAPSTDNTLAFEALWEGQNLRLYEYPKEQHLELRLGWFEEALMLDPEFVDAHISIARVWSEQVLDGTPWNEVSEPAFAAINRALEINPENPDANATMARLLAWGARWSTHPEDRERFHQDGLRYGENAVKLAPRNPSIREDYIRALWVDNDWDEIIKQLRIIARYAPEHAEFFNRWMVNPLVWAGRVDEAEVHLEQMQSRFPGRNYQYSQGNFSIHRAKGRYWQALEVLHRWIVTEPDEWVQDYMNLLTDLSALEAVTAWADFLAENGFEDKLNFIWPDIIHAYTHSGRINKAIDVINQLPETSMDEVSRELQLKNIEYLVALNGDESNPEITQLMSSLDAFCDYLDKEEFAITEYDFTRRNVGIAAKCYILSARTGADRNHLGEAVVRHYSERKPFKPGPAGSRFSVDNSKVLLIEVLARMGRVDQAVKEFREIYEQGFTRPYMFKSSGVISDPYGIFNGLGEHPEFLQMLREVEAQIEAHRMDIDGNVPWVLDPSLPAVKFD